MGKCRRADRRLAQRLDLETELGDPHLPKALASEMAVAMQTVSVAIVRQRLRERGGLALTGGTAGRGIDLLIVKKAERSVVFSSVPVQSFALYLR